MQSQNAKKDADKFGAFDENLFVQQASRCFVKIDTD